MTHLLTGIDDLLVPWFEARGQGAYRVGQVRDWLFGRRAVDFQQMTNLPQAVRGELAESFQLWTTEIARHTQAEDGTEKLLLTLADGGQIECVLLREGLRATPTTKRRGLLRGGGRFASAHRSVAGWAACSVRAGWTASHGT